MITPGRVSTNMDFGWGQSRYLLTGTLNIAGSPDLDRVKLRVEKLAFPPIRISGP
jgi:hypothetical protein